ncbi:PGPGW domain-containing protein [Gordonia zhaorongruii]|uniref:PGPGW domain-containing protein n=1 Tax=Gordonia zhaorongruii TaxID=2597659 RepID=UPI001404C4EB|nr:PGPGW domain-containing protein [Gordonia zhaorongruii]
MKIWHRKQRYAIRRHPNLNRLYRVGVAVVGTLLILAGIALMPVPIPGPAWGALFLGLGALSTEFEWAHRLTSFVIRAIRRSAAISSAAWKRFDAWAHRHVERLTGARLVQTWLDHQHYLQNAYAFA